MHLRIFPNDEVVAEMYRNHHKAHPGDAGFDLYCPEDLTVQPGETAKVDLKVKCSAHQDSAKEESIAFLITPRSSISKTPLRLANSVGLIDAGYRGNLMGLFDNIKTEPYSIKKGERLLQVVSFDGREITFEIVNKLTDTVRGEGGIGSTGAVF